MGFVSMSTRALGRASGESNRALRRASEESTRVCARAVRVCALVVRLSGAPLAVSVLLCSAPLTAVRAEPSVIEATGDAGAVEAMPALPQAYEHAIALAVDEHERGNFEEAREHFREAHELYPNARTLRGLGKVEFELRNYGESVKFLSAALASDVRPLGAELRGEVEVLLERARAYVGEVHVNVEPGSATVSVDGVAVASGPQAALDLLVGEHLLEFRASGHLSERRRIHVRGHDTINIQVVLAAPDTSVSLRTVSSERPPGTQPLYKKWWLWTAVGVAAGATVTAVALATRNTQTRHPPAAGAWTAVNP